jgi:uncharacterized membrane protein YdjX (TVP38/TMEM64 family)
VSDPPVQPRFLRIAKIAAVVAVIALLVVAQRLGVFGQLHDPAGVKRMLVALGAWGYLAFIVAYAALQPFGVPGTVFIFAAPLIWPWPVAFALSMAGTMAASVVGFSFARFVARDWVATMVPARFKKYDEAIARRGFATVFVLRLIFWMPPLLHAFLGLSKVTFWAHFWASALAYLLPLFLVSFFGEKLFDLAMELPLGVWIALGAALLAIAAGVWAFRRRAARARRADPAPAIVAE